MNVLGALDVSDVAVESETEPGVPGLNVTPANEGLVGFRMPKVIGRIVVSHCWIMAFCKPTTSRN
jgi:hypothetical protein